MRDIAKKFTDLFVEETKAEVIGDPMDYKTTVGPLVRENQRATIYEQVQEANSKGAKILLGGKPIKGKGFFFEPTVISEANHDMRVLNEEVFGPVAPIVVVENEEDAINEANNSDFGLGASIWTNNIDKGTVLAKKIQTGIVSINEMVRSDPRMPFGGIKSSGIGRELSAFGIKEFVNIKSVMVKDISSKLLVE